MALVDTPPHKKLYLYIYIYIYIYVASADGVDFLNARLHWSEIWNGFWSRRSADGDEEGDGSRSSVFERAVDRVRSFALQSIQIQSSPWKEMLKFNQKNEIQFQIEIENGMKFQIYVNWKWNFKLKIELFSLPIITINLLPAK